MREATAIDDYLPHRGAARLVDRLLEADDEHAVVEADIAADSDWVRDGGMPSWVGVELMAQAVAAWAGARARRAGRAVPVGFLLGTRRYDAHCAQFAAGSTLRITARRDFLGDNGLGVFDCHIDAAGARLAQARLSVFEPADARPYLGGAAADGR
jgi:predicted hotdog family 3-hydroxylacyl-ACP dehydratase